MSYDCECGFYQVPDEYYIFDDADPIEDCPSEHLIICPVEYDEETGIVTPKPPEGKKAYPVVENIRNDAWASYEFGGNQQIWDETHFCPVCKTEFTFSNGSC